MKLKLAWSITALLLAASGCFGGSDSDDDGSNLPSLQPPPPGSMVGGLWSGMVEWEPKNGFPGGTLSVRALVSETGEFRWVLYDGDDDYFSDSNEQVFGTLEIGADELRTTGDAIWTANPGYGPGGDLWSNFGLSAEFRPGVNISGDFQSYWTTSEERFGTLSMHYHSLYESPSSLERLQGTYTTSTQTLTIDNQGVIFYQSADTGCTGNGSAEVIDPDFNMYRVEMVMGSCNSNSDGLTFTGLASIGVNNEPGGGFLNETFEMAISAVLFSGLAGEHFYIPLNLLAHRQ